jgi:hypothetical protein
MHFKKHVRKSQGFFHNLRVLRASAHGGMRLLTPISTSSDQKRLILKQLTPFTPSF